MRLATRPSRYSRRVPTLPDKLAPSSENAIAVRACGRNIAPYAVLDSPYCFGSVKIALAAGKVTRTMP